MKATQFLLILTLSTPLISFADKVSIKASTEGDASGKLFVKYPGQPITFDAQAHRTNNKSTGSFEAKYENIENTRGGLKIDEQSIKSWIGMRPQNQQFNLTALLTAARDYKRGTLQFQHDTNGFSGDLSLTNDSTLDANLDFSKPSNPYTFHAEAQTNKNNKQGNFDATLSFDDQGDLTYSVGAGNKDSKGFNVRGNAEYDIPNSPLDAYAKANINADKSMHAAAGVNFANNQDMTANVEIDTEKNVHAEGTYTPLDTNLAFDATADVNYQNDLSAQANAGVQYNDNALSGEARIDTAQGLEAQAKYDDKSSYFVYNATSHVDTNGHFDGSAGVKYDDKTLMASGVARSDATLDANAVYNQTGTPIIAFSEVSLGRQDNEFQAGFEYDDQDALTGGASVGTKGLDGHVEYDVKDTNVDLYADGHMKDNRNHAAVGVNYDDKDEKSAHFEVNTVGFEGNANYEPKGSYWKYDAQVEGTKDYAEGEVGASFSHPLGLKARIWLNKKGLDAKVSFENEFNKQQK